MVSEFNLVYFLSVNTHRQLSRILMDRCNLQFLFPTEYIDRHCKFSDFKLALCSSDKRLITV